MFQRCRHWFRVVIALGLTASLLAMNSLGIASVGLAQTQASTTGNILHVRSWIIPGTEGDCSSWDEACELQYALDHAQSGDEIWATDGFYRPEDAWDEEDPRTATFQLNSGVALYGGFTGDETSREQRNWNTYETILSGNLTVTSTAYNVVRILNADSTTVLDGVSITGGSADGLNEQGGGIYISGSSPTLENLRIHGNYALQSGGGLYSENGSPTLTNVAFENNGAHYGAGAIMIGSGSLEINNVTFTSNSSGRGGGALVNEGLALLRNVTFDSNDTGWNGGAMINHGSIELTGVVFTGNHSYLGGGGLANHGTAQLVNVVFVNNEAAWGGGIFNTGELNLVNTTFAGNVAEEPGGGLYTYANQVTVANSIFWGNTASESPDIHLAEEMDMTVHHSIVQSGCPQGAECDFVLTQDPLFMQNPVPGEVGDLRLQLQSPAIDAGDNSAVPSAISTDILGYPRFADVAGVPDTGNGAPPVVDMGAYEARALFFVDQSATGQNNGLDWENAYTDLQSALTAAYGGAEIWVAGGTYSPTYLSQFDYPRSASFRIMGEVALYGGFGGFENSREQRDWKTFPAVLTGDLGVPNNSYDNAENVVRITDVQGSVVLDGFEITGGNANDWVLEGGGIYIDLSSVTLANLIIRGNHAYQGGGGIYSSLSTLTLTNVIFENNGAQMQGGAIYNFLSTILANNVTFTGNGAGRGGGALENDGSAILRNVTFTGNGTGWRGGGIENYGYLHLMNGIFERNHASIEGGGIFNFATATLVNAVFVGNYGEFNGGGISSGGELRLTNATFAGNVSEDIGGGLYISSYQPGNTNSVANSIFWGNFAPQMPDLFLDEEAALDIGSSILPAGCPLGATCDNILTQDPLFRQNPIPDLDTYDLRLQLQSPAIDAGDNLVLPINITTDMDGHPRFTDAPTVPDTGNGPPPVVDMGAYEFQLPNLALQASVNQSLIYENDDFDYIVVIQNSGLGEATSVTVTNTLPSGLELTGPVTLSPEQPQAVLAQSMADLPTLATGIYLAAGQAVTLTIPVRSPDDLQDAIHIVAACSREMLIPVTVSAPALNVLNVAPTVTLGPDLEAKTGELLTFTGSFTDPGPLDTHTIAWTFGDTTTITGVLTLEHTYLAPGVYPVILTVTDDDGGVGSDTLQVTVLDQELPYFFSLYLPTVFR